MNEANREPSTSSRRPDKGVRILVVDDDALIRWSLERSLGEAGFSVVTARDGVDAVEKLEGGTFEVVITDMQMPRMSGGELLSHVRQLYPKTKVLVMSGLFSRQVARDVVKAGASMFLQKPMDLKAINLVVERMIRGVIS